MFVVVAYLHVEKLYVEIEHADFQTSSILNDHTFLNNHLSHHNSDSREVIISRVGYHLSFFLVSTCKDVAIKFWRN
jgi:hypothetical protein